MVIQEIKEKMKSEDYNFLREHPLLGNNIALLGLGGSHAYGTNNETSDLDIRGCYLNPGKEILLGKDSEQVDDCYTDTVVYSFKKIIGLLSNCNPNVIEILGLKPEHYLYVNDIGQELIDNRKFFLSRKAINSFGGYANQQLYRLSQKCNNVLSQSELEEHICRTMNSMKESFIGKYSDFPQDGISLYTDKALQENYDTEIFMDIHLTHYPVRDYKCMWNEFNNMVKSYAKIGGRNSNAIEHGKVGKHMMHLVRIYYMCFDILEREEIITYREKEHELLMDIRNGKFLNENGLPSEDFMDMVRDLEKRFEYDKLNTSLPELPNYDLIDEFTMDVNKRVITNLPDKVESIEDVEIEI